MVVVRLSWFSGRALVAQARGVLGLTPSTAGLFTQNVLAVCNFLSPSVMEVFKLYVPYDHFMYCQGAFCDQKNKDKNHTVNCTADKRQQTTQLKYGQVHFAC